jgi:CRP-like cAMP-binding protein
VTIIDSGWVKVSVTDANGGEKILAVRGQGDVVGERAALTTQVRSATVTALDEVSAMVVPAAAVLGRTGRRRATAGLAAARPGSAPGRLPAHLPAGRPRRPAAWTAELQRRYADAEQQYRSLLTDRERILGAGHPDTAAVRDEFAQLLAI